MLQAAELEEGYVEGDDGYSITQLSGEPVLSTSCTSTIDSGAETHTPRGASVCEIA